MLDPDQIPGGVPNGAVPQPVVLIHRFLHDLGSRRFDPLECRIEVGACKVRTDMVPLAIIARIMSRSASVTDGSAAGGSSTIEVSGWFGGPTVIQRMS